MFRLTTARLVAALLTVLLMPASLTMAQGDKNLELTKKLKARKIERFFGRAEASKTIDAALKAKIGKLRPGAVLGGEYGAVHDRDSENRATGIA